MVVRFDGTVDDFVDVAMRGYAYANQLSPWQNVPWVALFSGLIPLAVISAHSATRWLIAIAAALLASTFYIFNYKKSIENNLKKHYEESLKPSEICSIEVEITEKGLSLLKRKFNTFMIGQQSVE
jgi:hypothetical protein